LNFALQFELGNAAQVLAQDFFLDLELALVGGVLVVAATAASKIGTSRLDSVRRRLYDCHGAGASEAGLLFGNRGLDFLSGKNKGNENSFAASAFLIAGRCGRKASQSVAAVDELFNFQEQELILRHERRQKARAANQRGRIAMEHKRLLMSQAAKFVLRAWGCRSATLGKLQLLFHDDREDDSFDQLGMRVSADLFPAVPSPAISASLLVRLAAQSLLRNETQR
jgi:hypothetical protein